jgi:hypothetical protein
MASPLRSVKVWEQNVGQSCAQKLPEVKIARSKGQGTITVSRY